jgi:hypothetical protein
MTQSNQLADDLKYLRNVVESRNRPVRPGAVHLIIWTCYCLICIPMYDFIPSYGGRINLVGWLTAAVASSIYGRRQAHKSGQYDRVKLMQSILHWYGGIVLIYVTLYGLVFTRAGLNATLAGQLSVILVGFLYFTAGVHTPEVRFMRWAGPVIILAGVSLNLLPHFRWTAMALIFAACLLSPIVFSRKPIEQPETGETGTGTPLV